MEEEKKWHIFKIDGLDTFNDFEKCREIVKSLHERLQENGVKFWWNYYTDHIRIGIFEKDIKIETSAKDTFTITKIDNPDDRFGSEIAEELNWIKFNACQVVTNLLDFTVPESKLYPSGMAYFIHLMMNALGFNYQDEAHSYSWLTHQALENIRQHHEKLKEKETVE